MMHEVKSVIKLLTENNLAVHVHQKQHSADQRRQPTEESDRAAWLSVNSGYGMIKWYDGIELNDGIEWWNGIVEMELPNN